VPRLFNFQWLLHPNVHRYMQSIANYSTSNHHRQDLSTTCISIRPRPFKPTRQLAKTQAPTIVSGLVPGSFPESLSQPRLLSLRRVSVSTASTVLEAAPPVRALSSSRDKRRWVCSQPSLRPHPLWRGAQGGVFHRTVATLFPLGFVSISVE